MYRQQYSLWCLLYSYADTVEKASSEADHAIRLLEGKKFKYPVYYDLEEDAIRKKLSKTEIANIAQTFCNKLSAKGYTVGIYANKDWFTNYLTDSCFNNWTKWVAQYNTVCNYQGKYDMWQCSCTGKISGISTNVDLNYSYSPFENSNGGTITRYSDGLNEIQGELYYFKNNRIDTSYSGLATYKGDTYLVTKGMVNKTQSGLVQSGSNWYMLTNGKLNKDFTDLYYYNNNWYYIVNGVLDWTFNGIVSYNNNLYYVDHSILNWNYNGIVEKDGTLYYVENGQVNKNYNGICKYNSKNYYFTNGVVDPQYTGVVESGKDLLYVKKVL